MDPISKYDEAKESSKTALDYMPKYVLRQINERRLINTSVLISNPTNNSTTSNNNNNSNNNNSNHYNTILTPYGGFYNSKNEEIILSKDVNRVKADNFNSKQQTTTNKISRSQFYQTPSTTASENQFLPHSADQHSSYNSSNRIHNSSSQPIMKTYQKLGSLTNNKNNEDSSIVAENNNTNNNCQTIAGSNIAVNNTANGLFSSAFLKTKASQQANNNNNNINKNISNSTTILLNKQKHSN